MEMDDFGHKVRLEQRMTNLELRIRIAQSLAEVPAETWNACVSQIASISGSTGVGVKLTSEDKCPPELSTREQLSNPFITHEFLSSLEGSASVGVRTDWQEVHPLRGEPAARTLGAVPHYVLGHAHCAQ